MATILIVDDAVALAELFGAAVRERFGHEVVLATSPHAVGPALDGLRRRNAALLPAPALERLSAGLEPVGVGSGQRLTRQSDGGDRFHLVERGRLEVTVDGTQAVTLGAR